MKRIILLFTIAFTTLNASSQHVGYDFVKAAVFNNQASFRPTDILIDKAGNQFAVGNISSIKGSPYKVGDFVIAKYDAKGKAIWKKRFPHVGYPTTNIGNCKMEYAKDGNIIIVGGMNIIANGDTMGYFNSKKYASIGILKMDLNGKILWATYFDGKVHDVRSFNILDNNTIVIHGTGTISYKKGVSLPSKNLDYMVTVSDKGKVLSGVLAPFFQRGSVAGYRQVFAKGNNIISFTDSVGSFQKRYLLVNVFNPIDGKVASYKSILLENTRFANYEYDQKKNILYMFAFAATAKITNIKIKNETLPYGQRDQYVIKYDLNNEKIIKHVRYSSETNYMGHTISRLDDGKLTYLIKYKDSLKNITTGTTYRKMKLNSYGRFGKIEHIIINADKDLTTKTWAQYAAIEPYQVRYGNTGSVFGLNGGTTVTYYDSLKINFKGFRTIYKLNNKPGTIGINTLNHSNAFTVYPNPTSGIIHISDANSLNIQSITVLDIMGKEIKTISKPKSTINLTGLKAGIYFLRIKTDKQLLNYKILME